MSEAPKTYSLTLRMRRVIYEDAFIGVPVTGAIMDNHEDGTATINTDALWAEAIRISQDPRVKWQQENIEIMPHPMQGPVPDGRQYFDAFYSDWDEYDP